MADRIIVLSDGTGNSVAKVWRTNVWRTFDFLDLTGSDQVAKYDDGVGSSSFIPWAIITGAFGWGLKRNVLDLYEFVCRNYKQMTPTESGSRLFGFGFSRGAFTIRVVMRLILEQGLVPYHTEQDLHVRARSAYRAYRAERYHSALRIEWIFRKIRDAAISMLDSIGGRKPYDKRENRPVPSIEFIGVWDTVAAYGLPIDEMTRGFSKWIWPLELPTRVLDERVRRACHALSLDDQRTTFHPVLWTEAGENAITTSTTSSGGTLDDERISQVWFAGSHANVGGGYPDDALAYIPLYWMMQEAQHRGLIFKKAPPMDPDAFRRAASARDKDGRQYNSRAGLAGYYRFGPRKLIDLCHMRLSSQEGNSVEIDLPKIHETALLRLRSDSNAYAPVGIPAKYAVVTPDRRVLQGKDNPHESPTEANVRAQDQEKAWNLVWVRRIVYFATLAASFHLAAFWLFHDENPGREAGSPIPLVSQSVRFVQTFLPQQVVHWWTDYYATNPNSFAIGIAALVLLIWLGAKLDNQITDTMRIIWKLRAQASAIDLSPLHKLIFAIRTSASYQAILSLLRWHILPLLSALFLIWLGAVGLNHLAFNIIDPTGVFCHGSADKDLERLTPDHKQSKNIVVFPTKALCFATGLHLSKDAKYTVNITEEENWSDNGFPTHPDGFRTANLPLLKRFSVYFGMPLRRIYFRRWFTVIARIGAEGQYEDYLDPKPGPKPGTRTYSGTTDKLTRDGELFLYVNDAVIVFPWLHKIFYNNNKGTAKIEVTRLGR